MGMTTAAVDRSTAPVTPAIASRTADRATNAEALSITLGTSLHRRSHTFLEGLRRWAQKGQLGSSNYTELSRYTGGRI